jgi:hypothetical protein
MGLLALRCSVWHDQLTSDLSKVILRDPAVPVTDESGLGSIVVLVLAESPLVNNGVVAGVGEQ